MARSAYSLALYLLLPVALLWFVLRGWRNPSYRAPLRAALALGMRPRDDRPLWLHAASIGEVQALAGLLSGLVQTYPSQPLLLTVGTPTGLAHARRIYHAMLQPVAGSAAPLSLQLAPWDLPDAATRFLDAMHPRMAVFVETELWPNQIAACTRRGVPMLLVSARVSARSLRRYQRFAPRLLRAAVRGFAAIAAQTGDDLQRFIALGADPAVASVAGNLKFDLTLPDRIHERGADLRMRWAPDRPLWVAGSTHAGEEAICLAAQRALCEQAATRGMAAPLLLLAPRRPERFAEVAQWLAAQGVQFSRLAAGAGGAGHGDVLLLDEMGDLISFYAAADVTFVGGTLVEVGGHNLLEPAALGKPVLAGPHRRNAPQVAEMLQTAGALITVSDAASLQQAVAQLFADAAGASVRGQRAAAVVAANRGATARALAMIAALCPTLARTTAPPGSAPEPASA